ncbi:hypothetical protein J2Y69_002480 [Microbacterium resistens]|uniref:Uncharacterized protein n=1 Tax=Microbacterium resistens TaxID=156977 RepID=A0ABU1SE82_9MICO|nr:hypothetical protein [Microbacterium resistens]MDR6867872.1 hypothetical protein [Microbacterium resistens]
MILLILSFAIFAGALVEYTAPGVIHFEAIVWVGLILICLWWAADRKEKHADRARVV